MKKIFIVTGARPNFMKAAPLVKEFEKNSNFNHVLVHTGQHYDSQMSRCFFDDLGLPEPDIYLGVGSGTHGVQTGNIMIEFEKVCFSEKPNLILVVGDVNSTVACAIVAAKLVIPVGHVEAGLRSFDKTMPEEINRILTDQISDYLFTTCRDADQNLIEEGICADKIHFVGNVMIDSLLSNIEKSNKSNILEKLKLKEKNRIIKYALLTLHRPSNVDNASVLRDILKALKRISKELPVIFPAHPRTLKQIRKFKLEEMISYCEDLSNCELNFSGQDILTVPPLGYHDFQCLMSHAKIVLTDSGGIQEETTILQVPCLTIRNNTERSVTITEGTNIMVGNDPNRIINTAIRVLKDGVKRKKMPEYWDGKAAVRIVEILNRNFYE